MTAAQAVTEGAPFVAIVGMHGVLVLTALLVVCLRRKGAVAWDGDEGYHPAPV